MITEDYVSFETAKLLKEKGFDYSSFYCYEDKGINDILMVILSAPLSNSDLDNTIEPHKCYSAPTLQMAMKWLREAHNIDIIIHVSSKNESDNKRKYTYEIVSKSFIGTDNVKRTYKESCETAIKYCLEKLI